MFWYIHDTTPYCISDFLLIYLISNIDVILDSLRQCYVSAPTQTLQVPCSEDRVDNDWITSWLWNATDTAHYWDAGTKTASRCFSLLAWTPCLIWLSHWLCPVYLLRQLHRHTSNVSFLFEAYWQGRRNRMTKSLEMRARLKLNAKIFAWTELYELCGLWK